MPYIRSVTVDGPQNMGFRERQDFTVKAEVQFTSLERELKVSYLTSIALYEMDGQMDAYSVHSNWKRLLVQRAARGDKDDFVGFSRAFPMKAVDGEVQTVEDTISVRGSLDPLGTPLQLRAVAICRPEFGTAVQWSAPTTVQAHDT